MKPPPSSTLRYWNLARERPCRPSASYRRATPVSPDRTARSAPHTGGKSPAFRRERAKSRETQTLRWRELDSNHRSRLFEVAFQRRRRERFVADSSLEEDGFELPVRGRGKPGYRPFCAAQAPSRSHSVATNASSSTGSRDRRSARISPLAQCGISNRHRICRPSRIPISTLLRRFRTRILCGDELAG